MHVISGERFYAAPRLIDSELPLLGNDDRTPTPSVRVKNLSHATSMDKIHAPRWVAWRLPTCIGILLVHACVFSNTTIDVEYGAASHHRVRNKATNRQKGEAFVWRQGLWDRTLQATDRAAVLPSAFLNVSSVCGPQSTARQLGDVTEPLVDEKGR